MTDKQNAIYLGKHLKKDSTEEFIKITNKKMIIITETLEKNNIEYNICIIKNEHPPNGYYDSCAEAFEGAKQKMIKFIKEKT